MTNEKKYLCLSFDDGPNVSDPQTMSEMLDIMEKYNVPASFFIIGNKVTPENKAVIKRAIEMGCDIQNHTWTHRNMAELSAEEIAEEYKKCDDLIVELSGKKAEFFRPPFISINDTVYNTIKVPFVCGKACMDWDPNYDEEYRYQEIIKGAENGTIYLLHVMEGNDATLKALDRAIPELKEAGYEFVNLPDLFKATNTEPNIGESMWHVARTGLGKRDR